MMPTPVTALPRPSAWAILEQAILGRRPLRLCYHGQERVVCPHVLGWKRGRAKVLSLQSGGTTGAGSLPADRSQRWRSMFIDEIQDPVVIDDVWQSADNYSVAKTNCIDTLGLAIEA